MQKPTLQFHTFLMIILICLIAPAFSNDIEYLFPVPGSSCVPAGTEILVRFKEVQPAELANLSEFISVTGSQSGAVKGTTTVLGDAKTIRFLPTIPFRLGETVTFQLEPIAENETSPFLLKQSTFQVYGFEDEPEEFSLNKNIDETRPIFDYSVKNIKSSDPVVINGVSVPANFPWLNIMAHDNPCQDYLFLNHGEVQGEKYNLILDSNGDPVWYRIVPDDRRDFKVFDNGHIGSLVRQGYPFGLGYVVTDQNFVVIDSFYVNWNGYRTDQHELQIMQDGSWYMIGIKNYKVDMSKIVAGGQSNATVSESAIFGFPAGSKTPNFIWRAFDHMDIEDTFMPGENVLTSNNIRFPHMNAIDIDEDGHILLSSRHASEVTKINRQTGEIIWRLGGENNQFTFINDPLQGPENQHDIRAVGNGRYTVFDNGKEHNPSIARGVEWELDTENMTATLTWEYRQENGKYSTHMGSHQRLSNGNRLINWAVGSTGILTTEVRPDGSKAFEFAYEDRSNCYRVFKFPWHGKVGAPYLVVEVYTDAITLIFNKFGDPDVDHYKIYAGQNIHPNTVIATTDQPFIHIDDEITVNTTYYFRVTAVDKNGQESGFSNEEHVVVQLPEPEVNLIKNGDFATGFANWEFNQGDANASYEITNSKELHFIIQNGGANASDISAKSSNLSLIRDVAYVFEFDAYADTPRPVFFDIQKKSEPFTNFSQIGGTALTRNNQHFRYEFSMPQSENAAAVVLSVGGNDTDVYVDNISLTRYVPEHDITDLRSTTIQGSNEHLPWISATEGGGSPPGEEVPMLIDNNINTKYLVRAKESWVEINTERLSQVTAYSITSANDVPTRDPKTWELQGWDGDAWVTIHSVANNPIWPERFQKKTWTFPNQQWFSRYRLTIHDMNGDSQMLMQMAELEILGKLGESTYIDDESPQRIISTFQLEDNYPNPFNSSTTIKYFCPNKSVVTVNIINILGEQLLSTDITHDVAGYYQFHWDGTGSSGIPQSTGLYFYQFIYRHEQDNDTSIKIGKMLLIK